MKYFLISFLCFAFNSYSQSIATILLISNQNAKLNFDGEDMGDVEANRPFKIQTKQGEHLIHLEALIDSSSFFKDEIVSLVDGEQKIVKVEFTKEYIKEKSVAEQPGINPEKILNSFTFYTTQGEKFYLILDGKKQNVFPETNIEVYNLDGNRHTVKIIFENDALKEIDEELKIVNANGEIINRSYAIKKHKRKENYELEVVSTEYKPGTSVWVEIGQGIMQASAKIEENSKLECERENYGTIMLKNGSTHPFNVYLDGVYIDRLYGGAYKSYNFKTGQHVIKVKQAKGYMGSPKTHTSKVNIYKCADSPSFQFQ